MWKKSSIVAWTLILSVTVYLYLSGFRSGGGHSKESPDGTALADITSYRKSAVFDKDHGSVWIEVSLDDKNNKNKQLIRYIDHEIKSEMFARGSGTIEWAEDSSHASFIVGTKRFTLVR